jgi:hypothetical protein
MDYSVGGAKAIFQYLRNKASDASISTHLFLKIHNNIIKNNKTLNHNKNP